MPASTNQQFVDTDVAIERAVMLELRDGVRLAADVYRPSGSGPYPVLLMRQPYGRDIASTVTYAHPVYFARRGFLVVIQDVRGRGDSEGVFNPFLQEAEDGRETIRWAARLPGANGRVGMYGFSYQGYTQLAVLDDPPEELAAIAPHMTAPDLYDGWFYRNGILQANTTLTWANQMLREDARRLGATDTYRALEATWMQPAALWGQFPLASTDPLTRPGLPGYAAEWLGRPERDSYWNEVDRSRELAAAPCPCFHLSGYFDFYTRGAIQGHALRTEAGHENDFFLLGPWRHIPWERHVAGLDWGSESRPDTDALLADWFRAHLTPDAAQAPRGCRYFVLGENQWRESGCWPPETGWEYKLHLTSGGRANSIFGDGELAIAPNDTPPDRFIYDPEVPVASPPGWGPLDLTSQQQGNNLLVYSLAPISRPRLFAGSPELDLYVTSTAYNTDFVARLSWVDSSGRARFLSLGAAQLTNDAASTLPIRLTIRLDPIAVQLAPGESLRLDLASSAFPLLARNPNTGQSAAFTPGPEAFARATQTVYHDTRLPSQLRLTELSV